MFRVQSCLVGIRKCRVAWLELEGERKKEGRMGFLDKL